MTVSSSTRKAGPFLGNGVTTGFPFTFKVFTTSDITLTRVDAAGVSTTLTLGGDYSIALNADQDNNPGGTITYPLSGSPLAAGQTLTGIGSLLPSQGTDLTSLGRFIPQVIENALDRLTILAQQVLEKVNRGVAVPVSESSIGALPALASRIGKFFAFDVNGNPIASSGTGTDAGLRTDLATSTIGALLVAFKRAGTGAVVRNVMAKLFEQPIHIRDFGAVMDGATDDAAAVQAALTFAASGASPTTRIVRFGPGDTVIASQLAWPDGVIWEGDYGRTTPAAGNNAQPCAIVWGGAAGVIAIVASTTAGLNAFGFKMRNLRLLATGANRPLGWVQFLNRCDSGTGFENVGFHFCTGPAVRFEKGGINVYIRGGRLDQCAGFYWNVQGLDNVSIQDMTQDHNASTVGESAQFFVGDHTTSPAGAKLSFTFKNINIEGNANLAAGTPYFEFKPRVDASGYPFAFRGTFQNVLVKPAGGVTEYTGIKVSPSADRVAFTLINTKLTWTGIPSAPIYDTTKDNQPFTVLAPHGTLDSASPAIEANVIDLRGEVNIRRLLQFGKPAIATLYADVADAYWNTNPSTLLAGQWVFNPTDVNTNPRKVKEVTVAGTLGTLAGVTGTGNIGTNLLTVNDASNLRMGHWITVVGDANPHKIALLDYTTGILQLANNLGATVAGAAVSFALPTYRDHRLMQTFEGSVVWDPPSILSAGTQTSTPMTVAGASVGDAVIACSASISLSGLHLWGEVTATDTVTVFLSNLTGGAVDRPSMTVFATVLKRA